VEDAGPLAPGGTVDLRESDFDSARQRLEPIDA